MKTKLLTYSLLVLLIFGMAALKSCNKDDDMQPEETFDINNPEGYFIYVKHFNPDGSYRNIYVLEFMPGKMLKEHSSNKNYIYSYTILDDHTIDIEGYTQFVFNGDLITSSNSGLKEGTLIKAPVSNQLAGKTFSGIYYKGDGSVLHNNFFYSFAAGGYTVDAGFDVGTTLRTENYILLGNFVARAELENGDVEFMVLVNGKLEVNYKADGIARRHYGTFTQQ